MEPRAIPEEAYVAALAELPAMWPSRLAALLGLVRPANGPAEHRRSALEVWEQVVAGRPPLDERVVRRCQPDPAALAHAWRSAAQAVSVERRWRAYLAAGVGLRVVGGPDYPRCLADDHGAPYVLYSLGDPDVLDGPRVAIVGTRRSTPTGREIALEFGRELAAVGVRVVSGLALGIDGAAHAGA
ncbi:MAG TPA: DNA-processing protein DprA, partial [Acidimicrobiales bacterium]|nr:DNA-processing protein DprA [Acidimicrobiales bacterium]